MARTGELVRLDYKDIEEGPNVAYDIRHVLGEAVVHPPAANPELAAKQASLHLGLERKGYRHDVRADGPNLGVHPSLDQKGVRIFEGKPVSVFTIYGHTAITLSEAEIKDLSQQIARQLAIEADVYEAEHPVPPFEMKENRGYTSIVPTA